MGARGPVPQREEALARPRSRQGGEQAAQPVTKGVARPTRIPRSDPDWHPIAKMLWKALRESGQTDFYQQSDWAFAYSLCDDLSHYKKPRITSDGIEYHKRSPEMLKALLSGMSSLLVTEGDRRRVRVELENPPDDRPSAAVLAIADYKAGLGLDD